MDGIRCRVRHRIHSFGQLQEGLKYELVRAPAVSVAQNNQQLCLAAQTEESRLIEVGRRRSYTKSSPMSRRQQPIVPAQSSSSQPATAQLAAPTQAPLFETPPVKRCFGCNQPGHFKRNCPAQQTSAPGGTTTSAQTHQICSHTIQTEANQPAEGVGPNDALSTVWVQDNGSKPRRTHVVMEGLMASLTVVQT
jgi:hypothetical protein